MNTIHTLLGTLLLAGVVIASGNACADKPSWAGKGGDKGNGKSESRESRGEDRDHGRDAQRSGGHFDDRQRAYVRSYYGEQFQSGKCPPGLAKKHNGCQPPGQAKKWRVGRPLPRDVVFYDLPRSVVIQLGAPPAGHKYVRAAADILLIAVGTSMVIDAIEDLGRM
jgi:hypothetical protein